jgi:hypothetical protein
MNSIIEYKLNNTTNIFQWNDLPYLKKGWIQCQNNNILIKENWNRKQWAEFIDTITCKYLDLEIIGSLQIDPPDDIKYLYKNCKNIIIENLIIENGQHFLTINEKNTEINNEINIINFNNQEINRNLNNNSNKYYIDVDYSIDRISSLFEQIFVAVSLAFHIKKLILKNVNDLDRIKIFCLERDISFKVYPITNNLFTVIIEFFKLF